MSKSLKLKNDNYIDSTGIVHGRKKLSDILNSEYEDISNKITPFSPSDLEIFEAKFKKVGSVKILSMILRSNTGFITGGATYLFILPEEFRPSKRIISSCRLMSDYDYPTWDNSFGTNAIGYLSIGPDGTVYVRYSGTTMKTAQIHIVY